MSSSTHDLILRLFEDYHEEVLQYLRSRVQCAETARDLSQEVFLRLTRKDGLQHIDNLHAYVFTTAQHLLIDALRGEQRRAVALAAFEATAVETTDRRSGETTLLAAEQLHIVLNALAELSPLTHCVFYLNRFEGLTHRTIAARLGVSVRAVEDNLKRAVWHCLKRQKERNTAAT